MLQLVEELLYVIRLNVAGFLATKVSFDFGNVVFEAAPRLFAMLLPPIIQKFGELYTLKLARREETAFSNFCPALRKEVLGEFQASLASALPHDLTVMVRVSYVGNTTSKINTPGHALRSASFRAAA